MLHIHNGDSTAGTLREFGFPGEHKAFREVLMEGPAPENLSPEEWIAVRARFLAREYERTIEECEKDFDEQEAWLSRYAEHDETILWFEHDLFCQIDLIYLLDWFAKKPIGPTRLSLICIGEFPEVQDFRGLGQLTGEQLASLFDKRRTVTDSELNVAAQAWAAYRSPDPNEIVRLIDGDTSAMPFLGQALRLHLERFPSVKNGLGRIDNKALELISGGAIEFKQLFPRFAETESAYGLGDAQLFCALERLGTAREAVITINKPANSQPTTKPNHYYDFSLTLTEIGKSVLAGTRDYIDLNGIDRWLGGVHLVDDAVWRWDGRLNRVSR